MIKEFLKNKKASIAILYTIIISIALGYLVYRIFIGANDKFTITSYKVIDILILLSTLIFGAILRRELIDIISRLFKKTIADKIQLITTYFGLLTLVILVDQLRENTKTNKLSIRDQLYTAEAAYGIEAICAVSFLKNEKKINKKIEKSQKKIKMRHTFDRYVLIIIYDSLDRWR